VSYVPISVAYIAVEGHMD